MTDDWLAHQRLVQRIEQAERNKWKAFASGVIIAWFAMTALLTVALVW